MKRTNPTSRRTSDRERASSATAKRKSSRVLNREAVSASKSVVEPKKGAVSDLYVESRQEWRRWLERNAHASDGAWVVIYKKETGRQTTTYGDLVEEALCFGWIDSVIRRINATCYAQRFTPRKPDSKWSPSNIERVKRLRAAGRMRPAGLAAFAGHQDRRLVPHPTTLPPDLEREFRRHARAWAYFDACPPRLSPDNYRLGGQRQERRDSAQATHCAHRDVGAR